MHEQEFIPRAICAVCGFDLTGVPSSVCPECGTDADLARSSVAESRLHPAFAVGAFGLAAGILVTLAVGAVSMISGQLLRAAVLIGLFAASTLWARFWWSIRREFHFASGGPAEWVQAMLCWTIPLLILVVITAEQFMDGLRQS